MTGNSKHLEVAITVDRYDRVLSVSSNWQAVAEEGGVGEALAPVNVIGYELSQFISSDNTRMYIEACLKLCRLKNEVLYRAYRCDSPTHKRFMELQLTPLKEGAVEMKHFLLREEPFDQPIYVKDVTKSVPPSAKTGFHYYRCSMCNKLKAPTEVEWILPEVLNLTLPEHIHVIHTVCPVCQQSIWKKRRKPN